MSVSGPQIQCVDEFVDVVGWWYSGRAPWTPPQIKLVQVNLF